MSLSKMLGSPFTISYSSARRQDHSAYAVLSISKFRLHTSRYRYYAIHNQVLYLLPLDLCFSAIYRSGAHRIHDPLCPWHPHAFLETVKQIYKQVFLRPTDGSPALEQEAFVRVLLYRSTTLESGTVLFRLYEDLEVDASTHDALMAVHGGVKHLRVEYLQDHWPLIVIFICS
ncbi:hypothetical protein K503DRAFT_137761 [Rhizopogon vinicolor AM-OR11-026]|uniref:Uncharacterized protein n=1 Tax=Rhizopogon vinicolor AM-OR11-026 TaxID=1314800 RepID=A0A1B7MEG5_9AGAM|nr:hypothetical protein K503DRAFT_137761 [Rhizopogon vinicolor AM-OR11-026]